MLNYFNGFAVHSQQTANDCVTLNKMLQLTRFKSLFENTTRADGNFGRHDPWLERVYSRLSRVGWGSGWVAAETIS